MNEIVQRAKSIIFSMEGRYSSVNCNDNGSLSIGACQWHGNRAKQLLKSILTNPAIVSQNYLDKKLVNEILGQASWAKRIITTVKEKNEIMALIDTTTGRKVQNELAEKDIYIYIQHVKKLGFTDEECIIFLADIENQGGSGSSNRIGKTALAKYGIDVTLEELLNVAINDKVFCKYRARRLAVYKKLMKKDYEKETAVTGIAITYYTVKSRDNLSEIAKKFGTTVDRIVKDNKIENKNIIIVGQKLKIQVGVK